MGVAFFKCPKLLRGRKPKFLCSKECVNDCIQIPVHGAPALRIEAAVRGIHKVYRQGQPGGIGCRVIVFDVQRFRIVVRITVEKHPGTLPIPLFKPLRLSLDRAVLLPIPEDKVRQALRHPDVGPGRFLCIEMKPGHMRKVIVARDPLHSHPSVFQ